jgi:hypothetical protein
LGGKVGALGRGERVSRQLITEYRSELDRIHAASGSKRESVVREAFKDLLKRYEKAGPNLAYFNRVDSQFVRDGERGTCQECPQ